jgi:chloride channel protein, CIC family
VLVGVVAGLGAVGFRALIAVLHNLLFFGRFSAFYDSNAHTPASRWGAFIILVPVLGAVVVAFLVKTFAPEAKGHGVPEVMDAVYHAKGVIRPIVSVIKAIASAFSIGSGGSIGREGPIIQIGASFGSTVGQVLGLAPWQRITLIAAGAGGGIAATFNTPVGGVLFAVEIIMHEVSVRTLVPVVTATATATYVGQLFFGPHPSFLIPALEKPSFLLARPEVLLAYAGLGAIAGLISALFIKSIYSFENFFTEHVKGGYYVQHMTGMLMVGLMMYAFMTNFGHYYVEGVGYATIQDVLSGVAFPIWLLLLLFAAKLVATSLTLGSGASGGVFSPALFMGATVGGAYGLLLERLFPALHASPAAFAVAGMGAVVGGATGAAMAAIVMIFEMTLDYTVVITMTLTVAIAYGLRRTLIHDSIYTRKLTLRGEFVPETLRADVEFSRLAKDVMNAHVRVIPDGANPAPDDGTALILADPSGKVAGVVPAASRDGGEARRNPTRRYVTVREEAALTDVIERMYSGSAAIALVGPEDRRPEARKVQGVITRKEIVDALGEDMDLFD